MSAPQKVVMVVDDDVDILRLVERALSQIDVEVVTRERAFGVLNAIAEHRPALVLLDVTMPGLDGPDVLTLIRADPDLGRTIVLFYSALPPDQLAELTKRHAADGFISKTDGPKSLVAEVSRRLGL